MEESENPWRARSRSFGQIAREYDRVRPSYPADMIDDIVGLLPGRDVAEIGAGTGKATVLLAARDIDVTAIEPDPQMAEVLTEHTRDEQNVRVVVSSFEDWRPDRPFDGLLAAQSWHWTPPAQRYVRAAQALRLGGLLALFWNITDWRQTPISAEIDEIYRRHGMSGDNPRSRGSSEPEYWVRDEINSTPLFTDAEVRSYPTQRSYTSQQWIDYVSSTSDHLIAPADRRGALLADVRRAIDASGGTLHTFDRCDLYLARRTDATA
jgi:SAM-dependent methyltransferase